MAQNYRQVKAIEYKNKKRLLELNSNLNEGSGIYFLTRQDEDGFKYAYIGQAKHILTRLAQHLVGYQHIDLSLKSHGLYSVKNQYGWKVGFLNFPESMLDEKEQYYIKQYADNGYQLRNKTSGSQGKGKSKIADYKQPKTQGEGIEQGYKKASKEISHLFELHLDFTTKSPIPNANQRKAFDKFKDFLNYHKQENEE